MKLRAICLGFLATLLLVGAASSAELVLDWPHNQDNGIYCFHCHSEDPETLDDWWITDVGMPTDLDFSVANWVCNRCHAPAGIRTIGALPGGDLLVGPTKTLHSSAETDSTKTEWTTQCIDCHDPHFQTQKDWGEGLERGNYVALGEFDPGTWAYDYVDTDVYHPINNPTGKGGPLGTTTIGIDVLSTVDGFDIVADWIRKGKVVGATDHKDRDSVFGTRGLILVVNALDAVNSRTYEIIEIVNTPNPYEIRVNGLIDPLKAELGDKFGILYGSSIRTQAITPTGFKDVKYFSPLVVADDFGGTVDLTPGVTEPVGLCQVCHDETNIAYYDSTTDETGHHDSDGSECTDCHDILEGGEPAIDHTLIITDSDGCTTTCHLAYWNNTDPTIGPDTAHIGSGAELACQVCHLLPAPTLSDGTTVNNVAARVSQWVSDGTSHPGAWTIDCIECHNATEGPALHDYTVAGAVHPSVNQATVHDGKLTAPPQFCVGLCHGTLTTASTSQDIVDNVDGHNADCIICHDTLTPSPVELKATAEPGRAGANCEGCHSAATPYFANHDHGVMNAFDGGNAQHVISNVSPCDGCHDAVAGPSPASASAPDVINPPYVGVGEVHYNSGNGCALCHDMATDGKPVSGSSAETGYGTDWSAGAGDCTTCHGAYFTSHTHHTGVYNDVAFNGASGVDRTTSNSPCSTCHQDAPPNDTTSLEDWTGIMYEHDTNGGKDGDVAACAKCHSYDGVGLWGVADQNTVETAISSGNAATCVTCHTAKDGPDGHGSHLADEFGWTAATRLSCGITGTSRQAGSCHDDVTNTDVVLNVHGGIATYNDDGKPCELCHQNVLLNQYARLIGADANAQLATNRQAACTVCHVASTAAEIGALHHENDSSYPGRTYDPLTTCATKCHHKDTGDAANHIAGTAPGMVLDRTDTGEELACSVCHEAYKPGPLNIEAPADGNNTPVDPLDDQVHDACTTCHEINGSNLVVLKASSTSTLVGDMPDGGAAAEGDDIGGTNGGGTCTACHDGYFEAHLHHDTPALNNFVYNFTVGDEQNPKTGVPPDDDYWAGAVGDPYYLDMSWDINRPGGAGPAGCGQPGGTACHTDSIPWDDQSLSTWEGIKLEHDRIGTPDSNLLKDGKQGCFTCHYKTTRDNGLNDAKFDPGDIEVDTISTVVIKGTKKAGLVNYVSCTDCHFDKKADNVHGLMTINHLRENDTIQGGLPYPPITDNTECSTECHLYTDFDDGLTPTVQPADIVIGIHSNSCGMCHVSQPNLLDADPKDFATLAALPAQDTFECIDCHNTTFNWAPAYHGVLWDDTVTGGRHDMMNDGQYSDGSLDINYNSCMDCHKEMAPDMAAVLHRHMPNFVDITSTPEECLVCHSPVAHGVVTGDSPGDVDTPATTVIYNGKQGTTKVSGLNQPQVCESCHTTVGDTDLGTYKMHFLATNDVNNAPSTSGLHNMIAISYGNCTGCHTDTQQADILTLHNNNCTMCHGLNDSTDAGEATNIYNVIKAGSSTAVAPAGLNCEDCHNASNLTNGKLHGLDADAATAAIHDQIASDSTGDTTCSNCHDMTTTPLLKILTMHMSPINGDTVSRTCLVCHNPVAEATVTDSATNSLSAISTGSTKGGSNPKTCISCHGTTTYLMHSIVFDATMAIQHNELNNSAGIGNGNETDCAECHDHATAAPEDVNDLEQLNLHSGLTNPCTTCHTAANAPSTASAATIIANGWKTSLPETAECEDCHAVTLDYTMHSLTADAATAAIHDKIASDSVATTTATADTTCSNCHDMTTTPLLKVLTMHMSPINDDTVSRTCLVCHNPVTEATVTDSATNALGSISSGSTKGGANPQTCISCHSTATYLMHSISFDATMATEHNNLNNSLNDLSGTETDCAECHTIGSDLAQLTLHTATLATPCTTCHTAGAAALGDAPLTISDGWKTTGSTTALCEDCHAQKADYAMHGIAVADVGNEAGGHENYLANFGLDSDCVACHTGATFTERMTLHPANPTYCLACHQSNSQQTQDSITAGVSGSTIRCETCHNGLGTNPLSDIAASWYNHDPNTDHTGTNPLTFMQALKDSTETAVPHISNCESCHVEATQVDVHDNVSQDLNPCDTCHTIAGALRGAATAYTKSVSGIVECNFCHATYPDGHTHHDNVNTNQVFFVEADDRSQNTDNNANACYQCHEGGLIKGDTGLEDWTSIYVEHNSDCTLCHNYTDAGAADGGGTPVETELNTAIATAQNNTPPILVDYVSCVDCHKPKEHTQPTSGHGGHDDSHFAWDGGCDVCHSPSYPGAPTDANDAVVRIVHGGTCDLCHTGTDTNDASTNGIGDGAASYGEDGDAGLPGAEGDAGNGFISTCTTCHPIGTYDLSTVHHDSLEWSVTNPGSCTATCHPQGVSAAVSGDHDTTSYVNTHANCSTCHTVTAASGFDMPVNADPKTHNSCQSCHNADPNATLRTGPLADANPIGGGTCETCHTTGFAIHASHDHALLMEVPTNTSTPTLDCQGCHTGGTAPWVTEAHTDCASCHDAVTGDLLSVNGSDATVDPGVVGNANGKLECGECHAAWFDGHKDHTATVHTISQGGDTDGNAECLTCHAVGGTANFPPGFTDFWDDASANDIFALHVDDGIANNSCTICHDETRTGVNETTYGAGATIQDVISTGGAVTCLDCHDSRKNPHGGHTETDFGWTTAMEQSCGGEGIVGNCHDYNSVTNINLAADDVVGEIHNGVWATARGKNCNNCHVDGQSGAGTADIGFYGDADARLASLGTGAPHTDECIDCHGTDKPAIHHNSIAEGDNGESMASSLGQCENCHMDRRPAAKATYPAGPQGDGDYLIIKQKACRNCHMQINAGSLEVISINYAKQGSNVVDREATGDDTGNDVVVVKQPNQSPRDNHFFTVDHTVPTRASEPIDNTAIDNYGTCYYCHGETGSQNYMISGGFVMDTPKMVPYHALPKIGAFIADAGTAVVTLYTQDNNSIGGNGFQNNLNGTGIAAEFRGGLLWNATEPLLADNAYHPVGKGRMNVGFVQHSLPDLSTSGVYKVATKSALPTYMNMAAGMAFGRQIVRNDSANAYYVPHFDNVCSTCDNITFTTVKCGGSQCAVDVDGSIWSITPNTDGASDELHVIYGGIDLTPAGITSGTTYTFDPTTMSTDQYTAANEAPIWVVSADGGSALVPELAPAGKR